MLIKEYMTPDPITVDESVSIMEAADLSKERGGRPVEIEEVMQRARAAVANDK